MLPPLDLRVKAFSVVVAEFTVPLMSMVPVLVVVSNVVSAVKTMFSL